MAILENASGMLLQYGSILIVVLMWLIGAAGIVGLFYLYMKAKQYKHYTVHIYKRKRDKEGKETLVFVGADKGAVLMDKKLKKRVFKLKRNNVHLGEEEGLNFDENRNLDIPSIPSEKGGEVVFVEKLGPKKFAVGMSFLVDGNVEVMVSEADVAEAIRAYDINAKYYGGKEWTKWIGPISFAVFAVLIIILFAVLMQKFEVMSVIADRLVETAQILASGRSSAVPT